jgi:hypothetical protein
MKMQVFCGFEGFIFQWKLINGKTFFPLRNDFIFHGKTSDKNKFFLILSPFFLAPNYVDLKKTLSISIPSTPHKIYMGFSGR